MADDKPTPKPFKVGEEPRPEASGFGSRSLSLPLSEVSQGNTDERMRRRAKSRLKTLRNFVTYSLRDLRPAEVNVWLAIFNCEYYGEAQIGYDRLAELAGKSKKHVGKAVNDLIAKGLVKRKVKGKFRPGKNRGLSSIYRVSGQMKPQEEPLPAKPR